MSSEWIAINLWKTQTAVLERHEMNENKQRRLG